MSQSKQSEVYTLLERGGPMTADELGRHPTVDERRIYPIRRVNPLTTTDAVWYLERHDRTKVLRRWLGTNSQTLRERDTSKRTVAYALSSEFDDAYAEVDIQFLDDNREYDGESDYPTTTCPRCGADDVKNLPRHLPTCDGEE